MVQPPVALARAALALVDETDETALLEEQLLGTPGPRREFARLSLASSPGGFDVEMEEAEEDEVIGSPDLGERVA